VRAPPSRRRRPSSRREPTTKTSHRCQTAAGSGVGSQPRARQGEKQLLLLPLQASACTAEPKTKMEPPLSTVAGSGASNSWAPAEATSSSCCSGRRHPRRHGTAEPKRKTKLPNTGQLGRQQQPRARQSEQHLLLLWSQASVCTEPKTIEDKEDQAAAAKQRPALQAAAASRAPTKATGSSYCCSRRPQRAPPSRRRRRSHRCQ
jgi:hypothetical protein